MAESEGPASETLSSRENRRYSNPRKAGDHRGDTSMTQQGASAHAAKTAGDEGTNSPIQEGEMGGGPPDGTSALFGLHKREMQELATRHQDELGMMQKKHISEHKTMTDRHVAEHAAGGVISEAPGEAKVEAKAIQTAGSPKHAKDVSEGKKGTEP